MKPLFEKWNQALGLVEFIEFYKLLGATHFVFYDLSVGIDVERVLRHYQRLGEVTVFGWGKDSFQSMRCHSFIF